LKPSGLPDLSLILSEVDAIAAGVFTTSTVRACLRGLLPPAFAS
jgi:glutamate N-acetyltransferase/amino-acid N-acetyltransferase